LFCWHPPKSLAKWAKRWRQAKQKLKIKHRNLDTQKKRIKFLNTSTTTREKTYLQNWKKTIIQLKNDKENKNSFLALKQHSQVKPHTLETNITDTTQKKFS